MCRMEAIAISLRCRYSYLKASIGSTRAARRAGTYATARATASIAAAANAIGAALLTGRSWIKLVCFAHFSSLDTDHTFGWA